MYICPERNYLEYVTTDRNGYREYKCKNDKSREGGKKTQARWMKMHEWIVEIVQKAPDKETALDELEKSRKAGPPKSKTE